MMKSHFCSTNANRSQRCISWKHQFSLNTFHSFLLATLHRNNDFHLQWIKDEPFGFRHMLNSLSLSFFLDRLSFALILLKRKNDIELPFDCPLAPFALGRFSLLCTGIDNRFGVKGHWIEVSRCFNIWYRRERWWVRRWTPPVALVAIILIFESIHSEFHRRSS